jgi:hypothetical protein
MRTLGLLLGVALGAGVTLLLDPERGRRRRAIVRDKVGAAGREAGRVAGGVARDLANRTRGAMAEARARVEERGANPPDEVLVARVRARLGTVVSHPRAIGVRAEDGRVVLEGAVLADELEPTLAAVRAVRGVAEVESRLQAHAADEHVPALQGGRRRGQATDAAGAAQGLVKVATAVAGGALTLYGARRRSLVGRSARTLGQTMLGAALSGTAFGRWSGASAATDALKGFQTRE